MTTLTFTGDWELRYADLGESEHEHRLALGPFVANIHFGLVAGRTGHVVDILVANSRVDRVSQIAGVDKAKEIATAKLEQLITKYGGTLA